MFLKISAETLPRNGKTFQYFGFIRDSDLYFRQREKIGAL